MLPRKRLGFRNQLGAFWKNMLRYAAMVGDTHSDGSLAGVRRRRLLFSSLYMSATPEVVRPNQSLEPTPKSVTDRAGARSAPAMGVAQH